MFEKIEMSDSNEGKLPDEVKVHPLQVDSIWGRELDWKLISKTKAGGVTIIKLASDISEVGCLVNVQCLNDEGQVFDISTVYVPKCRIEARTNEGKLSRFDLVQMHGISING